MDCITAGQRVPTGRSSPTPQGGTPLRAVARLLMIAVAVCALLQFGAGIAWANNEAAPGWFYQAPAPILFHCSAVALAGDEAWAVGGRLLLHSENRGRSWRPVASPVESGLDVTFVDPSHGWILASDGTLQRTVDGGATWTQQDPGAGAVPLVETEALDDSHVWVVGGAVPSATTPVLTGAICLRSTDGGTTWQQAVGIPAARIDAIDMVDDANGWAAAEVFEDDGYGSLARAGRVLHTTDGGATWAVSGIDQTRITYTDVKAWPGRVCVAGTNGWTHAYMTLSTDGGATWSTFDPTGLSASAREMAFTDSMTGWAVTGDDVAATTDGGTTWASVLALDGAAAVACAASGEAVAASADWEAATALAHRAPGGSWGRTDFALPLSVSGIDMMAGGVGWVVGTSIRYYGGTGRTLNAGASWQGGGDVGPFTEGQSLRAVAGLDANTAAAVGDGGVIAKTTDGGATWAWIPSPTSSSLTAVVFDGPQSVWAVGGTALLHSVDAGASWNPLYLPGSHTYWDICRPAPGILVAVGEDELVSRGCVLRSADGGSTWSQVLTATSTGVPYLDSVTFVDASHGWAAGEGPSMYATTNGGLTWQAQTLPSVAAAPRHLGGEPVIEGSPVIDVTFRTAQEGWALHLVSRSSGVRRVLHTSDGGVTWAEVSYGPFTTATDSAGGETWFAGGAEIVSSLNVDTLGPVTTLTYPTLWTNQAVTVGFGAVDAGCGVVASTQFSLLGGAWSFDQAPQIAAPHDHANDGVWDVTYFSRDRLDNAEAPRTAYVKIDTQAPVMGDLVSTTHPSPVTWYRSSSPSFVWGGDDGARAAALRAAASVTAVAVSGGIAVFTDDDLLCIYDVSNPWRPLPLGSCRLPAAATDVTVAHGLACVACGSSGLACVDLSDPAHPVVAGETDLAGPAVKVATNGTTAYVAAGAAGLIAVDVSTPDRPRPLTAFEGDAVNGVALLDGLCYAAGDCGLWVLDASRPGRLDLIGACELKAATSVAVEDGLACVGLGPEGFTVLDVREAESPVVRSTVQTKGDVGDVDLSGRRAAVADASVGLLTYDLSVPDTPMSCGYWEVPGALDVSIDGQHAYFATGVNGLQIVKAMAPTGWSYVCDRSSGTVPPPVSLTATPSVSLAGVPDGISYFHVRPLDEAGNWGGASQITVRIDTTPPVTADNAVPVPVYSFRLVLSPADATSGVATTQYRIDGGAWITGTSLTLRPAIKHKRGGVSRGSHLIEYRSTDFAGNMEIIESCTVRIGL